VQRLPAQLAFVALTGALFFLADFHPAVLDISNAGWLIRGSDGGENALGMHAWLHDPASLWSLRTGLLNAPEGTPLLFTDSNPLLGLLLKPFAGILPPDAQFVGVWLLACCLLQALFGWLLLRRYAPGQLALWCGVVLLCALPTWFNRYLHANLFGHWLILWALWIFTDKQRAARFSAWAPPLIIAAMVHNYLLIMVAAIWGSALLERFATLNGSAATRQRVELVGGALAIVGAVALIARWHGLGEHFAVTGSYGAFALPLDALWNPANPGYGTILPAIPQREGRGYEGFQYLGLGILLMLGLVAAMARRLPSPVGKGESLRRFAWLAPAFLVLTLLAISSFPDFAGRRLPRIPPPDAITPLLDLVRASGRLFWPVAYTLVLAAILLLYRLGARRAGLALAALLAIQTIDIAPEIGVVRQQSAEAAQHRLYVRTRDPRWATMLATARDITFEPSDVTRDLALFQEVAWRATSLGRPVRLAYTARISSRTAARLAAEGARFTAGDLDPHRLYVLIGDAPVPAQARERLLTLDGVRVIRPV